MRKKSDDDVVQMAVIYVARKQPKPLATVVGAKGLALVERYDQRQKASVAT